MADLNTPNQGQSGNGAGGDPPAQGEEMAVDITSMSKDQLLDYAKKIGVEAKPAMNIPEILKAIQDFQKAKEGADATPGNGAGGDPPGSTDSKPPAQGAGKNQAKGAKDESPVGTIRTNDGIEEVKISADKWVPTVRENIISDKPVIVVSKKRAGKTIFAKTGKPITFDENWKATVSAIDGLYLKSVIIDNEAEYTVEGNA